MALSRERIVQEALALLDEAGLDGLSLRKLATRLGIQAPTLYWYVRDKRDLVGELGEAILRGELAELPDATDVPWREWLLDAAVRFRRALLSHRDGARIVSAAQLSPTMAAFSERAMSVLVAQGQPRPRARLLVLLIERFTIGLVLEEQSGPLDTAAAARLDPDELAARYPTLTAAIQDYFGTGATLDDLYHDSLRLILGETPTGSH